MKYTLITISILSIFVASCKKDKSSEEEEAFVGGITITSPTTNDSISGNQSIITGSITGNMTLHGYHLVLYKVSDNSVLAELEEHTHSSSITIADTLTYTVSSPTPVRLHVESAYNHEGDVTTKDVNYVIQP